MRSTRDLLQEFNANSYELAEPAGVANFSGLSDASLSIAMPKSKIKPYSKVLPAYSFVDKREAFKHGSKAGTGSAQFYRFISKLKEFFGILPKSKGGKLVDAINVARNEARIIYANLQKMFTQLDKIMFDVDELSPELKKEAALMTVYLIERSYKQLKPILMELRMMNGLLKGNAERNIVGMIVAGKTPSKDKHPYLQMRDHEKEAEMSLLEWIASDEVPLQSAMSRLAELGVSKEDFRIWTSKHAADIEVCLNNFKGAGCMVGASIQALIFISINFGIAAAIYNPLVLASGVYYTVSTAIRICEMAIKIKMQNQSIREELTQHEGGSEDVKSKQKTCIHISNEILNKVKEVHCAADVFANTAFLVSANTFLLNRGAVKPSTLSYGVPDPRPQILTWTI